MGTLKKYDIKGAEVGSAEVGEDRLNASAHPQSLKDYIVAIRKNKRQWSACTKTRAEINRTGRKPHAQKGQGRSRQGDLAAPQYKGGGVVFGPKPKFDMHVRINKKERRAAIRSLIIEKIKENRVHILSDVSFEKPQTKVMADFFKKISAESKRVLVLSKPDAVNQNMVKSLRNLPKKEHSLLQQVNGYTLMVAHDLVVLESALDEFLAILG